jgi:hypothetical protein
VTPIGPFEAAASQFAASIFSGLLSECARNPDGFMEGLHDLLEGPHHTGYDACQDILDAVEGGHLSHGAALQAIAVLMADMERREQRPAAPRPETRSPQRSTPTAWGDLTFHPIDLAAVLSQFA